MIMGEGLALYICVNCCQMAIEQDETTIMSWLSRTGSWKEGGSKLFEATEGRIIHLGVPLVSVMSWRQ